MDEIFSGQGVEIQLTSPETFLKVKETLTRIGIASNKEKALYQSCHILHKRGRYSIMHFKEMFILDGKINTITNEDVNRRNTIVKLLNEWNLITLVGEHTEFDSLSPTQLKVLSFADKGNWELKPKYNIGKK